MTVVSLDSDVMTFIMISGAVDSFSRIIEYESSFTKTKNFKIKYRIWHVIVWYVVKLYAVRLYTCYFIPHTAVISIDQMNWTWYLLNIPRVDIVSVACMTGRNYDRDIIMNYATSCQFEDYQVWTFYSLVSMLAFIHFLWHPLKTCIESHHEMNDVLWHDIDKYLIKMCYMVMFVLTTKLWNLGNIGKKYYFFSKVNGDLSNPFREISNGMKFEVCCFDLYVKCVLLLTRTKHVPLFFL